MGNCLKTQLKESVANDKLLKLEEYALYIDAQENPDYSKRSIQVYNSSRTRNAVATLVGGYFTDSTGGQNLGTSITIDPVQAVILYVSNNDCMLKIYSKHDTVIISGEVSGGNLFYGDLSQLNYIGYNNTIDNVVINLQNDKNSGNIDTIIGDINQLILRGNVGGDISNFRFSSSSVVTCGNLNFTGTLNITNNFNRMEWQNNKINFDISQLSGKAFSSINVSGNNVTGDISSLSTITSNERVVIKLIGTSVTGELKDLLVALWTSNNTRGLFFIDITDTNATFNGSPIRHNLKASFSSSGITLEDNDAGGVIATYDGSTWTYNS